MPKKKYDVGGRKWNTTTPPLSPDKAPQNMLEVIKYEHKGISVYVEIDYLKGHISLVDHSRAFQGKEWKFTERSIEYMQGWKNILEAMKMAVEFAETKLRMRQEEKQGEIEELLVEELTRQTYKNDFSLPKDFGKLKQV